MILHLGGATLTQLVEKTGWKACPHLGGFRANMSAARDKSLSGLFPQCSLQVEGIEAEGRCFSLTRRDLLLKGSQSRPPRQKTSRSVTVTVSPLTFMAARCRLNFAACAEINDLE